MCGYVPPQGVQPRIRNINQIINRRHADLQQLYVKDHFTEWRNVRDFASIQEALDDLGGNGVIFVPSGTYNENLVSKGHNVLLFGMGWSSYINGGTTGNALRLDHDGWVVQNIQIGTTTTNNAIYIDGKDNTIFKVYIPQAGNRGIYVDDAQHRNEILFCKIYNAVNDAIRIRSNNNRIIGCRLYNAGNYAISLSLGDNNTIIGINSELSGNDGIFIESTSDNNVIDGNRITGWTNEPIDDDSGTNTIGDNDTT